MFQCTSHILYPEDNRFAMLVCQATARKNMDICYNYQQPATPSPLFPLPPSIQEIAAVLGRRNCHLWLLSFSSPGPVSYLPLCSP